MKRYRTTRKFRKTFKGSKMPKDEADIIDENGEIVVAEKKTEFQKQFLIKRASIDINILERKNFLKKLE